MVVLLFMFSAAWFVNGAGSTAPSPAPPAVLPNVVIFMADDLGYGDVGCFGNTTIKTPHIDSMAWRGAKFTHHIAAEAVCTPSRAAFMTGRYPIRYDQSLRGSSWGVHSGLASPTKVGMPIYVASSSGLPPNETTFAEVLKDRGYSTGFVGKWHLGLSCETLGDHCYHPLNQGFDSFYGLPLTNLKDFGDSGQTVTESDTPYYRHIMVVTLFLIIVTFFVMARYNQTGTITFIVFVIISILLNIFVYLFINNGKILNSIVMRNHTVVEQPIRFENFTQRLVKEGRHFLEDRHSDGKPFLLFMSWLQVHTVLSTAPEFVGRSEHGEYGDNVEEMDWSVGEILSVLDQLGMTNNTLVYFTSDNGGHVEETGPHGDRQGGYNGIFTGGKAQGGMEGGIRMPTVAMWPSHIPPGLVVDEPTSLMDMFPTIIAVAGGSVPTDRTIDGRDIMGLLEGQNDFRPHKFLFHYCGLDIHAARYMPPNSTDVWKLRFTTPNWLPGKEGCSFLCYCYSHHTHHAEAPLLYDVTKDPSEHQALNISSNPKYEKIVEEILNAVGDHERGVVHVMNQMSLQRIAWRPWLQPCCNYPYCKCRDPMYDITQ